jgi:hypothetical protein
MFSLSHVDSRLPQRIDTTIDELRQPPSLDDDAA